MKLLSKIMGLSQLAIRAGILAAVLCITWAPNSIDASREYKIFYFTDFMVQSTTYFATLCIIRVLNI